MKFARRVFFWAGVYGIVFLTPMYLMEHTIGEQDPPAITHPEFFYGFLGCALAWQVLFLLMSRNPLAYRALIPAAILEKLGFGIAVLVLLAQNRISPGPLTGGLIDLLWAVLFACSYYLLGRERAATTA